MLVQWIGEQQRCIKCGLAACGCAVVVAITASFWHVEEPDDGHKVQMPTSVTAPTSGSGTSITMSAYGIGNTYLSGAIGDAISEREYRLQPCRGILIQEPRAADAALLAASRSPTVYDHAGWVTISFLWPPQVDKGAPDKS
jgi:hypothetical protein